MVTFQCTNTAHRQLKKMDPQVQQRVLKKLSDLKEHPTIFAVLQTVENLEPATHRLRIGEYRLLMRVQDTICIVTKIAHRRDVYQ